MKTGIVKFFKADKGYGFIIADDDKVEYYVHATRCEGMIEGGYRVSFDVIKSKKGVMADNVKIIRD